MSNSNSNTAKLPSEIPSRGSSSSSRQDASKLLVRQGVKKWALPENFDEDTLLELFQLQNDGQANKPWTCPICDVKEHNVTRLHEHALSKHSTAAGMLDLLELSVNKRSRGEPKKDLLERIQQARGVRPKVQESVLYKMAKLGPDRLVRDAMAVAVVDGGQPLSVCEASWPLAMITAGIEIGFRAGKTAGLQLNRKGQIEVTSTSGPTSSMETAAFDKEARPLAHKYMPSRRTLTPIVDDMCVLLIDESRKRMLKEAKLYGATQLSDGRSNINCDPLLVVGVWSRGTFFPQGAHNAGPNKKDAEYLTAVSLEYLNGDPELEMCTFASVSDGAKACLNSLDDLSRKEHLVPIRCQSHAVSLFIKEVAKGPFARTISEANDLITWVRGRPRIHTMIRNIMNKPVFRFIETRFGSHVVGCARLVVLRPAFVGMIPTSEYEDYRQSQSVAVRAEFSRLEALIERKSFWDDLRHFTDLMAPATVALRLMDESSARCKDVNSIWTSLGSHLAVELEKACNSPHSPLDKGRAKEVFLAFEKCRVSAHRPIFDAAFALDPTNLDKIRSWMTGHSGDDENSDWPRIKKNTLDVLRLVASRKTCLDMRAALRSASESATQPTGTSNKRPRQERSDVHSMVEINQEELAANVKSTYLELQTEFYDYCIGRGAYVNSADELAAHGEDLWLITDGKLKFYAIRILNMACTISDVERMHKVYAGIHTSARNSLTDERADRLSMARICSRLQSKSTADNIIKYYDSRVLSQFKSLSREDEELLVNWGARRSGALLAVQRTINEPCAGGFSFGMVSSEDAEALLGAEDAEARLGAEEVNGNNGAMDIREEPIEQIQEAIEDPLEDVSRNTGPRLPAALRSFGAGLGLYGQHLST